MPNDNGEQIVRERIVMSSVNTNVPNIEKLRGSENFSSWSFGIKTHLQLDGLWSCVEVAEGQAVDGEKDNIARCKLILSLDKMLFVYVQQENSARGVWKKLCTLFRDTGLDRRNTLLQKICSIELVSCDSVDDYVNQVTSTALELSEIGFNVSDEWMGGLLLKGLPVEYKPMIMALSCSSSKLSADDIKVKILQDVKIEKSQASLVSSSFKLKSKKKFTSQNKKSLKCFNCNGDGHKSTECPSPKKEKSKLANVATCLWNGNVGNDWYLDSGASMHMTRNFDLFQKSSRCNEQVRIADGNILRAEAIGDIEIYSKPDDSGPLVFKDVLYLKDIATNLLSISKIVKKDKRVIFDKNGCRVLDENNKVVATATEVNGMYKLDAEKCSSSPKAENPEKSCLLSKSADNVDLWHRRMGHLNAKSLRDLQDLSTGMSLKGNTIDMCRPCLKGKAHRLSFPDSDSKTNNILELIHSDLCGPMEVESIGGSKYFLTFIDDYSKKVFVYFLEKKSQVCESFENFRAQVENQAEKKIKKLRTDNGTEYVNSKMKKIMLKNGYVHQTTIPFTPEQNGTAERMNRTLLEKARCMMAEANLPKKFWAEAVNTAAYLVNRSPCKSTSKTPEELWSGKQPNVSHLKVFGCIAYHHIPKQ